MASEPGTSGNRTDRPTLVAVVETIAEAEGVDPLQLPPLYRAIDPAILEMLVEEQHNGIRHVEFEYLDYRILVADDGMLQIRQVSDIE